MGLSTSCSGEAASSATWQPAPGATIKGATTEFTAIVSRVGCSSGVQGEPQSPTIEYGKSEIRVTFTIAPEIASGTCEGTPGVPYEVKLTEPVGERALVDAECHRGSTAWATAFCLNEGVRYTP
jgi:hypothetical protein